MHPLHVKDLSQEEHAELLEALLTKHPQETVYVAWDNATTHFDDEKASCGGRLVLMYLPTYSPWPNPIEMLWRHFRREVTHCELFESVTALVQASSAFFRRYNETPERVFSIIGAKPSLSL